MPLQIGYIGLGALGSAIAPNISTYATDNSHPPLIVWNRSTDKYDALKSTCPDVQTAASPEELAGKCDVVFTCLVNDAAAEEVYGKLVTGLNGRKVVFADQTTVKAGTALKIKKLVEDAGAIYLTTTVFGQPPAAKARQLVCVSSGREEGRKVVEPILEFIGKKVIDVGEDNAKGAALKLLGNGILLGAIQVYSEMYALSDVIGFDPTIFHELHKNLFAAPALLNYSNKISQGAFGAGAGFTVLNGLKDAGHILSMGEELGHPLSVPTLERAQTNLNKMKNMGHSSLDWSSLSAVERTKAGLEMFREGTDNGTKPPQT